MKKLIIAGICLAMGAASYASVIISKDVRGPSTWDAFTVKTLDSSVGGYNTISVTENNATGLGQSFTATQSGYIDAISFGVTRMYANLDGVVNVYEMYNGDGVTPEANPTRFRNGNLAWMSDAIASISFNTASVNINSSGDGNNMYTFNLSGLDQIAVTTGHAYMVQIAGAGTNAANLVLWDKLDAGGYNDGTYGVPNGGTTTVGGRDAYLAINIIPEPATFGLISLCGIGALVARRFRM